MAAWNPRDVLRSCTKLRARNQGCLPSARLADVGQPHMEGLHRRLFSQRGTSFQVLPLPIPTTAVDPKDTASQPKPLRFFRKKNLSQNMICFQVASNGSVEDHTVCPDPKPLVFGRRGCWGASPAASGPQGPTACCCCQTAGWGSAPHPGRLCPRSAVKRWLPGGTCSSVRCHPSATAPLPAV